MQLLAHSDAQLRILLSALPASEIKALMMCSRRMYELLLPIVWKNISLCPPRQVPEHALEDHALEHPGTSLPQDIISPWINPNITNNNEADLFLTTVLNSDASPKALACIETLELGPRYFYQREDAVKALKMLSRAKLTNLKMIQVNLGCDRYKTSKGAKNNVRNDTVALMNKCMAIVGEMLHRCKAEVAIQACYPLSFDTTFGSPVVCAAVRELGVTFVDAIQTHSELANALTHLTNLKILNIKTYNGEVDNRLPILHYYQAPLRALKKLEQLGIASGSILNSFHAIHFPPNLKILSLIITPYYGPNPQLWKRVLNRDFPKLESFYFAHSFNEADFLAIELDQVKISSLLKLALARTPLNLDTYKRILTANRRLRRIEIKPDPDLIALTLDMCADAGLEQLSGGKNVDMPSEEELKDCLTEAQMEKYRKVVKARKEKPAASARSSPALDSDTQSCYEKPE